MLTTMQLRSVKSIMFSICFGWIMAFFTALRAAENTESLPFIFWHYNHVSCGGDYPFRNMKLQLPANLNCYNETTMHQKGVITRVLSDWRTCVWLHQPRSSASPNGNTSLLILPQILTFPLPHLLFLHCSNSNRHNLEGVNKSWLRWTACHSLSLLSLNKLHPHSACEHVRRDDTSC